MGSLTIRLQEIPRDGAFFTCHLLLRAVCFRSQTYLEEINFHLNVVANWRLRDRGKFSPLFSVLGFQQTHLHAGPNHAASFSVSSRVIWSRWTDGFVTLVPKSLWFLYTDTTCCSLRFLSLVVRDLVEKSYLRPSITMCLTLWILSGFGSLHSFPSAAGGSFSDDDWARHLSMNTAECHWIILLLHLCSCFTAVTSDLFCVRFLATQTMSGMASISWSCLSAKLGIGLLLTQILSLHYKLVSCNQYTIVH